MAKKSSQAAGAKKTSKAPAPAKKAKASGKEAAEKKTSSPKKTQAEAKPKASPAKVAPAKAAKVEAEAPPVTQEAAPKKTKKPTAAEARAAAALTEETQRWVALKSQHGNAKAPVYKMSEKYAAGSPLSHPRLGWGFVLNNVNDRLEVIFETGIKTLISNYKS